MKPIVCVTIVILLLVGAWWLLPRDSDPAPFSNPDQAYTVAMESLLAGSTKHVREAIQLLESSDGYAGHVQVLDAAAAVRANKFDNALRHLMAMEPDDRLRNDVLLYSGQAYYGLQQLPQAEVIFASLLTADPDNIDGHRMLGAIYYDLGAYDNAFIHLKRVTELVPDDFRPHRVMGLMYRDFEQNTEAIEQYRLALDKNPVADVVPAIKLELAETLVAQKKFVEAETLLTGQQPSVRSLTLRARCAWNRGDAAATDRLLADARKMNVPERTLSLLVADVESSRDNSDAAISEMMAATKRWPHDAECHYRYAQLLRESGRSEESAREMELFQTSKDRAMELTKLNIQAIREPQNADVREQLAELCDTLDRSELAEMWRRAAESIRAGIGQQEAAP